MVCDPWWLTALLKVLYMLMNLPVLLKHFVSLWMLKIFYTTSKFPTTHVYRNNDVQDGAQNDPVFDLLIKFLFQLQN
jgi:hypothetical protein